MSKKSSKKHGNSMYVIDQHKLIMKDSLDLMKELHRIDSNKPRKYENTLSISEIRKRLTANAGKINLRRMTNYLKNNKGKKYIDLYKQYIDRYNLISDGFYNPTIPNVESNYNSFSFNDSNNDNLPTSSFSSSLSSFPQTSSSSSFPQSSSSSSFSQSSFSQSSFPQSSFSQSSFSQSSFPQTSSSSSFPQTSSFSSSSSSFPETIEVPEFVKPTIQSPKVIIQKMKETKLDKQLKQQQLLYQANIRLFRSQKFNTLIST
jgi:hypothetical protein